MRIIGGAAGGRILKAPKGFEVRPTPDLVRQAIFNSLGARVTTARVLELFAGTGALAIECLSRGAIQAVCVEKATRVAEFLRRNLAASGLDPARLELRVQDSFGAIAQFGSIGRRFDLVLADPPYGEKNIGRRSVSFAQQLLDDRQLPLLLGPGGLFVLGHAKRDVLELPRFWSELKMLKHGDSTVRMLAVNDDFRSGDARPD